MEKTSRSGAEVPPGVPKDAMEGLGGEELDAPPPPEEGDAGAEDDPAGVGEHAPLLPEANPATTHGVVSDFTFNTLPGGWFTEMVALGEVGADAGAAEGEDGVAAGEGAEEAAAGPFNAAATSAAVK